MTSPFPLHHAQFKAIQGKQGFNYPQISQTRAVISVSLSIVLLAYSGLMSVIPIFVFYLLWFPFVYHKQQFTPKLSIDILPHVAFGIYCLLSTIWSDYPSLSAYSALELSSMLLCTVIMARLVNPSAFIKGIVLGSILVLCPAILSKQVFSLFGSKNQVGYIAEIGFLTSLIYLFGNDQRIKRITLSVFSLIVCGTGLLISHSATSDASCFAVIGLGFACYLIATLPPWLRVPAFILFACLLFLLAFAAFYLGLQATFLQELGKDTTLTGRTYLWSQGINIGMNAPILGHGMSAFWVPGQPQAEKYWYEFHILNRSGFHFHNLYIQTFVDLGIIGVLLILSFIYLNFSKSLRYIISYGASAYGLFFLGLSIMFFLRGLAEVDYLGPFGIGPFLFYAILPMLRMQSLRLQQDTNAVLLERA